MDRGFRKQYMQTLREKYLKADKEGKGAILDEYCRNTGMDRIYVSRRFNYKAELKDARLPRKARKETYDGLVKAALVVMWTTFDYPCGARLSSILKTETEHMRTLKELACSDEVAQKLQSMVASTIDEKLKHEKEVERLKQKYSSRRTPLICSKVPVKTSADLDRSKPGVEQIDFVEHCGVSASGEYVNSLSIVDIFSGWWEGDGVMGKGQERSLIALDDARKRCPFTWKEMHPDNGTSLLNYHVYEYAQKSFIEFSRSRPYKKNDNCFVEQKNSTHVRQVIGYLRYDTEKERLIISDLYRNELRLYKNFFQPVMKVVEKVRVGVKVKKKFDTPATPYRRLLASDHLTTEEKQKLTAVYVTLNPAELKRCIDAKLSTLHKAYAKHAHQSTQKAEMSTPLLMSLFIGQPTA
jgi:hypothetical protein